MVRPSGTPRLRLLVFLGLFLACGFCYAVRQEVGQVRCACRPKRVPALHSICRHTKLFAYHLTHAPLCLFKLIVGGSYGLVRDAWLSIGPICERIFLPLVYARNLFLYHLVHPVLLLVRVVISPFVLFEKVISPNVFPADSEPIGYWLAAFKCVGQKVHHILRIPLSLIVWVDNWIDRAVIRIFETYAGPFVDLPPPGEAQVCGTGAGKAEMLDKLADLENNSEQAKQFVDELSRDAE